LRNHHQQDDYLTKYIPLIKNNPLAKKVKIADLTHNADLNRLESPTWKDILRISKYLTALNILKRKGLNPNNQTLAYFLKENFPDYPGFECSFKVNGVLLLSLGGEDNQEDWENKLDQLVTTQSSLLLGSVISCDVTISDKGEVLGFRSYFNDYVITVSPYEN
jgi:hypothetical protein